MKNQHKVSIEVANLSFINDKVRPNIKEGERNVQIVGYGQRQSALSAHGNRYWKRELVVLTRGYVFEIVEIEKINTYNGLIVGGF